MRSIVTPPTRFSISYMVNKAIMLLVLMVVSACSVLPEAPPPRRLFDLGVIGKVPAYKQLPVSVDVARPHALKLPSGDGMLIRSLESNELSFLPEAAFPDRLTSIIQARFIEGLANSNGFLSVTTTQSDVRKTVNLSIRVFVFEVIEGEDTLSAHIRMKLDLYNRRSKDIIATKIFSGKAEVEKAAPAHVASSLGKALNMIEAKAFRWIYVSTKTYIDKHEAEEQS